MAPRLMTLTVAFLLMALAIAQQQQQPSQMLAAAPPLAETPRLTLEDVDWATEARAQPDEAQLEGAAEMPSDMQQQAAPQDADLVRQRRTFGSIYFHKGYHHGGYYPRYYSSWGPRYYSSYYRPYYHRYYW